MDGAFTMVTREGPGLVVYGSQGVISSAGRSGTFRLFQRQDGGPFPKGWSEVDPEGKVVATGDDAGLSSGAGRGGGRRDPNAPAEDVAHWAECVVQGQKPILSAEHARHVVEIMERAVIASQTGQAQEPHHHLLTGGHLPMKAARLYGPRDLRVESVPDPRPGPGEALIRIHACGVCPSDLRSYLGSRPGGASRAGPRTPGHEWAGEIVALGERHGGEAGEGEVAEGAPPDGEPRLQVGDRVVADPRYVCGRCYQCRRGVFNYCERLQRIVRGGFAEYGVSPLSQLRRLPDHVSYEEASFCEPLACVVNGNEMTPMRLGDDVVIVGAGPIGLMHLQLARARGPA